MNNNYYYQLLIITLQWLHSSQSYIFSQCCLLTSVGRSIKIRVLFFIKGENWSFQGENVTTVILRTPITQMIVFIQGMFQPLPSSSSSYYYYYCAYFKLSLCLQDLVWIVVKLRITIIWAISYHVSNRLWKALLFHISVRLPIFLITIILSEGPTLFNLWMSSLWYRTEYR